MIVFFRNAAEWENDRAVAPSAFLKGGQQG